jgi:hypothetical protein
MGLGEVEGMRCAVDIYAVSQAVQVQSESDKEIKEACSLSGHI